jgi:simple sugar transport system permease protein
LQRTEHLPDAAVNVLQGILFIVILASETLRGRLPSLGPSLLRRSLRTATTASRRAL